MGDAVRLAVFGGAALGMIGAIFGVFVARLVWAADLEHVMTLRTSWVKQEASLRGIIDSQKKINEIQAHTIEILKGGKP